MILDCDLPDCRDPHCPMCGHPLDCLPECTQQTEECPWNTRAPRNRFLRDEITVEEFERLVVVA